MYEILPEGLYLCSVMATKNKRQMEQMGITHILSLGHEPMNVPENGITKYFDILDDDDADLYSIVPEVVTFIGEALASGGKIIVHCFAGASRSASCVIAYIMKT